MQSRKKGKNKDNFTSLKYKVLPRCSPNWVEKFEKQLSDRNLGGYAVKPTRIRILQPLYYNGLRIKDLFHLPFGGYEITLETDEKMRISYKQWFENVYQSS